MTTATSDAAIADLQRKLAASQQAVSRLEHELSTARAATAAAERKNATLSAQLSSRAKTPEPAPPPPPPPPAPPPASVSPGMKAKLASATARIAQLEAEIRKTRDELESQALQRLAIELKRMPDPGSRDRNAAALAKAKAEIERVRDELDEERERRRSAERLLNDAKKKGTVGGPLRVPEPPPPPKPIDPDWEKQKAEETRRMIKALDGRLGKLEDRKLTHEEKLQRELNSSQKTIAMLQSQLQAANALAVERRLGGGSSSARPPFGAATQMWPRQQQLLRPASPRDALSATHERVDLSSHEGGGDSSRRGGRAKPPPMSKEEKMVQRLEQLDPKAAKALHERKGLISGLRERLVTAQAQTAVELTRAGWGVGNSAVALDVET